jgi:polysaccharide biosynthesis transport protein
MASTPAPGFSVFAILDAIRRRKLLLIIPTLVLGIGFSYYASRQPNVYKAEAMLAAQALTPPEYLKHVAPPPLDIQDHLWTVREVMLGDAALSTAGHELSAYRSVQGPLPQPALDELKKAITIKVDGEHTFSVGFEGDNPQEVANFTNKLSELFVNQASARQEQKTEDTQSIIQKQLDDLKGRLAEEDQKVRQYKQNAANELPEHVDDNIRAVDSLREQYQEIESKIADEQARHTSINKEMRELEAQGALDEPTIAEKTPAEVQLDTLRIKLDELKTRYKAGHPDVVRTEREIANLQNAVTSQPKARRDPSATYLRYVALKSELDGIVQRMDSYRRQQQTITAQMAGFQRRVEAAPRHERALDSMTREMTVGESQLHALLDKKLDTSLAQGLQSAESGVAFEVVQAAQVPTSPSSPQRERMVLMGIFAGLGLGIVVAFLLEQSDTSFGNVDDFQAFTTLPVTGVIPNVNGNNKESARPSRKSIVALSDPESVPAEQYRVLAMKLHQQCSQSGSNVVMLTSAAGGEGKSLTAVNLSMAMTALVDGPVLLIDADMRKPRLHEYLETKVPAGKGFHNLLLNPEDDFTEYSVKLNELTVITGSALSTGNPIAALASPKARVLFDRLKERYKMIIVDAPPTLPIADSHLLSGLCDKVLFVVRARKTPRELFQHAVESFDAGNLIGAVLNDVDYQHSRYAYAYQYYKENYTARK